MRLRTLDVVTVVASLIAVAQSFFAVHHLGILAGLVGLARLARPRPSRATRAGLIIAAAGMVALTACELFAITAAGARVGTPTADAVDASYSVPMLLIGVGLVLAGVGLARRPVLPACGC